MRILLFGPNGQVGQEIRRAAPQRAIALQLVGREAADLTTPDAAAKAVIDARPDAVVIAAAYTAVDKAEDEAAIARRVNAEAPGEIAAAAARVGAAVVHISTDYVFDGAGATPLGEDAPPRRVNVYGRTKLEGEAAVLGAHPQAAIVRTSWVYAEHGKNFVKTMLALSQTRDALTIVGDQIGGPTPAAAIAAVCLTIAERARAAPDEAAGVFHFQGAPAASWADFARAIFEFAERSTRVTDIPTKDYPTPARRPLYTVLDCAKIKQRFNVEQPDWRTDLRALIPTLIAQS